jgi:hypothetical protein
MGRDVAKYIPRGTAAQDKTRRAAAIRCSLVLCDGVIEILRVTMRKNSL